MVKPINAVHGNNEAESGRLSAKAPTPFHVTDRKRVLVEQHYFCIIRAGVREVGKLLPDGSDQAGLSLHAFVVGHRAKSIADPESGRIPQMERSELTFVPFSLIL
jgi:hypothetical protein